MGLGMGRTQRAFRFPTVIEYNYLGKVHVGLTSLIYVQDSYVLQYDGQRKARGGIYHVG